MAAKTVPTTRGAAMEIRYRLDSVRTAREPIRRPRPVHPQPAVSQWLWLRRRADAAVRKGTVCASAMPLACGYFRVITADVAVTRSAATMPIAPAMTLYLVTE